MGISVVKPSLRTALRVELVLLTLPKPKKSCKEKVNNKCGNPPIITPNPAHPREIATPIFFEKKKLFRNDGLEWEFAFHSTNLHTKVQ
jgi:hypothetical protein